MLRLIYSQLFVDFARACAQVRYKTQTIISCLFTKSIFEIVAHFIRSLIYAIQMQLVYFN